MRTEEIIHDGRRFALILRKQSITEKIRFFTEDGDSLQIGRHKRQKSEIISPHRHVPVKVEQRGASQEVLYIEYGRVKITFFGDDNRSIEQKELVAGDLILLIQGGHSFEFLDETEMIEIKQGPYNPDSTQRFEEK